MALVKGETNTVSKLNAPYSDDDGNYTAFTSFYPFFVMVQSMSNGSN